MSIQKPVAISFDFVGDGSSTVVTLDLERDPFQITTTINSVNWSQDARSNKPVSAKNGTTTNAHIAFTATLSYPTLTITFASAPGFGQDTVSTELFFN